MQKIKLCGICDLFCALGLCDAWVLNQFHCKQHNKILNESALYTSFSNWKPPGILHFISKNATMAKHQVDAMEHLEVRHFLFLFIISRASYKSFSSWKQYVCGNFIMDFSDRISSSSWRANCIFELPSMSDPAMCCMTTVV